MSIFCKSCQIWINVCFFGFFLHVVQKFPAPFIEKMIFLYCISFTLFRKINNIGVGLVMDTVFPPKTYSDNIVFYVENSERSIKQLLELQSEFTRVAGYQVNVKKKKINCIFTFFVTNLMEKAFSLSLINTMLVILINAFSMLRNYSSISNILKGLS